MAKRERCYNTHQIVTEVSKKVNLDYMKMDEVFEVLFHHIMTKIMAGYTVQLDKFGSFKLKHLGRRVQLNELMCDHPSVSEEHLKIHFMAYDDLKRRARRKLMKERREARRKAEAEEMARLQKEQEQANDNQDV